MTAGTSGITAGTMITDRFIIPIITITVTTLPGIHQGSFPTATDLQNITGRIQEVFRDVKELLYQVLVPELIITADSQITTLRMVN